MFRSPKDHPQGVRQALLKLPLCTINMYAYVGDVGASFACLLFILFTSLSIFVQFYFLSIFITYLFPAFIFFPIHSVFSCIYGHT